MGMGAELLTGEEIPPMPLLPMEDVPGADLCTPPFICRDREGVPPYFCRDTVLNSVWVPRRHLFSS